MDVKKFFSQQDLELIQNAVKDAEKGTSGEIVPFAVGTSDHYHDAAWEGAAIGALLAAGAAAVAYYLGGFWGHGLVLWISLPAIAGVAAGYLLVAAVPGMKRLMIHADEVDHRVAMRAAKAFLDQEVFKTRERTGVLVFLSLFERRVVILADAGINARVEQHEWDGIVAAMSAGIRSGKPGHALAEGIRRCGELLARDRVVRRADDEDELTNGLRLEQE